MRLCESRGTCIERDLRCCDKCDEDDDDESVDGARGFFLLLCGESFGGGGIVGFFSFGCDVTFNGGLLKDVLCDVLGGMFWWLCKGGTNGIGTSCVSDDGIASVRDIVSVFSQTCCIFSVVVTFSYTSSPLAKTSSSS